VFQYVELISSKQSELDQFVAEGYKAALTEERRRYCFLVDRQCVVSKNFSTYHGKVKDLLTHKYPAWQQSCTQPTKLPERAMALVKQTAANTSTPVISDPLPSSKPVPVPAELAPLVGGGGLALGPFFVPHWGCPSAPGGQDRDISWSGRCQRAHQPLPPQPLLSQHPPLPRSSEVYSSTLPMPRKLSSENRLATLVEHRTLPRINPLSVLPPRPERRKVEAVFPHTAGSASCTLLSFSEGDVITLLVPEARDGWHYGENETTKMKGWFPFSYTRPLLSKDMSDR
uniref:BAR/IMD domain containing adaptor protein 2a n=1 Tax=Latimeria chalumnae TaxID=7897 RepID=H2ZSA0_LATCH